MSEDKMNELLETTLSKVRPNSPKDYKSGFTNGWLLRDNFFTLEKKQLLNTLLICLIEAEIYWKPDLALENNLAPHLYRGLSYEYDFEKIEQIKKARKVFESFNKPQGEL